MLAVPELEIRTVRSADMDGIVRLEQTCFDDPYPRHFLEQLAAKNSDTFLVAVWVDKTVGYAVVERWEDSDHLVSIAVQPAWRRNGIAQRILMMLESLVGRGRPIRLEVRASNVSAIGLYLKNGFRQTGLEEGYYRDGENALLMEKHRTQ